MRVMFVRRNLPEAQPQPAVETPPPRLEELDPVEVEQGESRAYEPMRVIRTDSRFGNLTCADFDFSGRPAKLVFAYVSPHVPFAAIVDGMRKRCGTIPLVATTTSGELRETSNGGRAHSSKTSIATQAQPRLALYLTLPFR